MAVHPELVDVEQVADGWVKKFVLTYRLPNGDLYYYHCATRRDFETYRAELERNAAASKCITDAIENGDTLPHPETSTADAVCVVAKTSQDTLVMIREFRYPLNSWCVAFPAGLIDPGEDALTCACRELQEETGYTVPAGAHTRVLPQAGYSSTGLTDETVQIVFVEAEKLGDAHTEPGELIEVFELPICDIRSFLDTNTLPIGTRCQLILEIIAAREGL